jgi:hypothetical protein
MKLVTDNAFTKAWKKECPRCVNQQPSSMLWYKDQCHDCDQQELKNALALLRYMKGVEDALEDKATRPLTEKDAWPDYIPYNSETRNWDKPVNFKPLTNKTNMNKKDWDTPKH